MTPTELAATLRRWNEGGLCWERDQLTDALIRIAPAIPDLIESAAELSDVHHTSCSSFYDEDWGCNCQAGKLRAALSAMCEKGGAA